MSTIVAISTAPGVGGIGIIRMSGENCFTILQQIFKQKKEKTIEEIKGYSMKYGNIINPKTGKTIDEVLVSYFKKPYSYTTENMCEINSHGGMMVVKEILEVCLDNGAQLAEAGEFTKRAFLNGRLDLSQAEAIIDIIHSKTEKESKASVHQLEGFLSDRIKEIRTDILSVAVDIEANIDYPEYDVEEISNEKAMEMLNRVKEKLEKLESTFDQGKIIKEGIQVAIIGKPNAGKSSLLNALVREERAIVTEVEGTTRDTIEEFITVEGVPLKIIDTAGIRQAKDAVEKIGIAKAREVAKEADIVIYIIDGSKTIDQEEAENLVLIQNKKAIIVLNKIDIGVNKETQEQLKQQGKKIIKMSALKKQGVEELLQTIAELFQVHDIQADNEVLVTNVRHKNLIKEAIQNNTKAIETLQMGMPIDVIEVYIKEMLESLGKITGENVSENMIREIFSKFCLGK